MGYHISVPEYEMIAGVYRTLAEENLSALCEFYNSIAQNCRRTRYKPMVDFTNVVSRFYNEDFRAHLYGQYQNWAESEYSLDSLARRIGAGEDAIAVGRHYMEQIGDSLQSLFAGGTIGEISLDTSHPEVDNQLLLDNAEAIRVFLRSSEMARNLAVGQIQVREMDNDAFSCITNIVRSTGDSMIACFQRMLTQVNLGEELFGAGAASSVLPARDDLGSTLDADTGMDWPFEQPFL